VLTVEKVPAIKAVLFDFDGTLTKPEALELPAFKKAIRCPAHQPILEFIAKLPSRKEQEESFRILHQFEFDAATVSQPNSGAQELMTYPHSKNLAVGIIGRNSLGWIWRNRRGQETTSVWGPQSNPSLFRYRSQTRRRNP